MSLEAYEPYAIYDKAAQQRAIRFMLENDAGFRRGCYEWGTWEIEVGGEKLTANNRHFIEEDELAGLIAYRRFLAGGYMPTYKTEVDQETWSQREQLTWLPKANRPNRNTFCNIAAGQFCVEYGAPNLQYHTCGWACPGGGEHPGPGTFCERSCERNANKLFDCLLAGNYDSKESQYVSVDWKTAAEYAGRGGFAVAVWKNHAVKGVGHIATLLGGYAKEGDFEAVGDEAPANLRIFQAGTFFGYMTLGEGFDGLVLEDDGRVTKSGYEFQFYVWISRERRYVCQFPLSPYGAQVSPPHMYFNNESGVGGFYPLGLHQNLHAGIHVHPEGSDLHEVRCMAPGYVVAARLAPIDQAGERLIGTERSFVLVRHEFKERDQDGDPHALYSLYMHLTAPEPNGSAPQPDWLEALEQRAHGSLVVVDPEARTPGTLLWSAKAVTSTEGPQEIHDPLGDDALSIALAGKSDRPCSIHRAQPVDVAEARAALESGAVVTFSGPMLPLRAGELVGHVRAGEGDGNGKLPGFLHWELLAPENAGLKTLLDLAKAELGLEFPLVEDKGEGGQGPSDNYWERDELNGLLKTNLPQADQGAIEGDLLAEDRYSAALLELMQKPAPLSFALGAESEGEELCYPYAIYVENPGGLISEPPRLSVRFEPGLGSVNLTADQRVGEDWTGTVQVPAKATELVVEPASGEGFQLALGGDGDTGGQRETFLEREKEFLGALVGSRWRHVRVQHVTDWSEKVMRSFLEGRGCTPEKMAELEEQFLPVCWWGAGDGETPIVGTDREERSLFDGFLPESGEIDNVHPVTGLWLLNTLASRGKLDLVESWEPAAAGGVRAGEPEHWGWVTSGPDVDKARLGDVVHALVVSRGYAEGGGVTLKATAGRREVTLGHQPLRQGVAALRLAFPFWGTWKLEIVGHRGSSASQIPAELAVSKPVPQAGATGPQLRRGRASWLIPFREHKPARLEGWILLHYWKTREGDAPSGAPTLAQRAIPAHALGGGSPRDWEGFTFDESGEWITAAADPEAYLPPGGTYHAKEYAGTDHSSFKLSVRLALLAQELRLAYPAQGPSNAALDAFDLDPGGLGVHLRNHYENARTEANLRKLEDAANAMGCFETVVRHAGSVEVSVADHGEGGALALEFYTGDAIAGLLEDVSLADGEALHVAFGFLAPNGGRRVVWPGGHPPDLSFAPDGTDPEWLGRVAPALNMADVRSACGDDVIEIPPASESLLSLSRPRFGDLRPVLQRGNWDDTDKTWSAEISLQVPLLGDPAYWEAAEPRLFRDGNPLGAKVRGQPLLEHTIKTTDANWTPGSSITLEAKVEGAGGPAPRTYHLDTTPRLEDLEAAWEDGLVRFVCYARAVPTAANLTFVLEKETEPGTWIPIDLQKQARFDRAGYEPANHPDDGRCDEDGLFGVSVPRRLLSAATGCNLRARVERRHSGIAGISIDRITVERTEQVP